MKKMIAFWVGCVAVPAIAAEVSFSEPQVALGQAVQLIFKSDKAIQTPPDLTVVQKHFVVSGTQQMMNSSFVNGRGTQSYELIYTLFPKTAGTVELSGLSLDGENLSPVSITVLEQGVASAESETAGVPAQVLELTATVVHPEIYQGESFVYTIRLAETVGVSEGTFQPPEMAGARIQPLGQAKTGTQTVDGKTVRVAEQSFLITPESAGTLTVPPASFMGVAPDGTARRRRVSVMPDFFDNDILFGGMRPTRQIYLQTKPMTVTVQAKPADWQGWWLPSTEVLVSEQYNAPHEVRAGVPFERKVFLSARGVDGNGLPLLTMPQTNGLNVYPSPEKRQTQLVNADLLGTEEVTFALVPTTAGTVRVPEIRIPWFDTYTKQIKTAVLPEKVVTVLPAAGQVAAVPIVSEPKTVAAETVPAVAEPVMKGEADKSPLTLVFLFTGGVLAGLVSALGIIWAVGKRRAKRTLMTVKPVEKKRKSKKPLPDLYPF